MVNARLDELRSEINARALDLGKVTQELEVAAQIQAGLLPEEVPQPPGWQLAATLVPARQTSGDFYDFIPLPGGRLGIVIADVADKGAGAALYMTLSRTLIRTYAAVHADQPALVLSAANERILAETHTDMFATLFYGVLDPATGQVTYCNAGHNPPLLLRAGGQGDVQALGPTGLPLGIQEEATWEQHVVELAPGDTLALYTDGVTEAQTSKGMMFGQERLLAVAQAGLGRSAQEIQDSLLAAIRHFVGNAPQSDDITLMVIVKE
jgi:serine phosphatase RsbU (regulator of sigma subunit)